MILITKVMNESNLKEKLFEIFSTVDCDFTGENGEEYLWDEAKEQGFKSNLDYSLEKSKIKYGEDVENIIKDVISSAQRTWDGYYIEWDKNVIRCGKEYVVSMAVITSCD